VATFVIVHGGWGGGWEWRTVADALGAKGHRTYTPTLTGLGDRSHILTRSIGLRTHAEDVAQTIVWEREHDVFVVGHSYGGMVTTVAATMVPESIRGMIYVDAFVPEDGQREIDLLDPDWVESRSIGPAKARGDGWLVPFPFPEDLNGYPPDVADRYRSSMHPLATFTDPASVDPAVAALPTAFLHCTAKPPGEDAFSGFARTAQERGWLVTEIESGHDVQIEQPGVVARRLHEMSARM
jgi:pimeloyl-ACP methyl ester carboxylesterase